MCKNNGQPKKITSFRHTHLGLIFPFSLFDSCSKGAAPLMEQKEEQHLLTWQNTLTEEMERTLLQYPLQTPEKVEEALRNTYKQMDTNADFDFSYTTLKREIPGHWFILKEFDTYHEEFMNFIDYGEESNLENGGAFNPKWKLFANQDFQMNSVLDTFSLAQFAQPVSELKLSAPNEIELQAQVLTLNVYIPLDPHGNLYSLLTIGNKVQWNRLSICNCKFNSSQQQHNIQVDCRLFVVPPHHAYPFVCGLRGEEVDIEENELRSRCFSSFARKENDVKAGGEIAIANTKIRAVRFTPERLSQIGFICVDTVVRFFL